MASRMHGSIAQSTPAHWLGCNYAGVGSWWGGLGHTCRPDTAVGIFFRQLCCTYSRSDQMPRKKVQWTMDSYLAGLADLPCWSAGRRNGLGSGCLGWSECPRLQIAGMNQPSGSHRRLESHKSVFKCRRGLTVSCILNIEPSKWSGRTTWGLGPNMSCLPPGPPRLAAMLGIPRPSIACAANPPRWVNCLGI